MNDNLSASPLTAPPPASPLSGGEQSIRKENKDTTADTKQE